MNDKVCRIGASVLAAASGMVLMGAGLTGLDIFNKDYYQHCKRFWSNKSSSNAG